MRLQSHVATATRRFGLCCGILLTGFACAAGAEDVTYSPDYLAFLAGYGMPSKSLGTTGSAATASAIFGHQFASYWSVEVNVQSSTFETGPSAGTDYYQNGGTVDLVFGAREGVRTGGLTPHLITPFALAGIGGVYDDLYPNNRDAAAFIAEVGVGAVTRPLTSWGVRLRIDARYVHDSIEGGHGEKRVIAGLDIPLGRTEHRVEYLPAKAEIR